MSQNFGGDQQCSNSSYGRERVNLIANLAWALGVCGCGPGTEMEMEMEREMEVIDSFTTIEFYTICGD